MKASLQVEEGISNWLLVTIVISCAAPAITLNVWPRIEAIVHSQVSSNQIGIVLLVTLSALGMTCVPFAMKKAENWGFWLTCLLFGFGLGILNYTMAVGAVGKSRDEEAGAKAQIIEKARALRSTISENEKARRDLSEFKWTTKEMVQNAVRAVDLADQSRKDECQKVGDHCRARVVQLASRQSELAELGASRASTERAEEIDRSIRDSRKTLAELGPIPESTDQQASRLAAFLGAFLALGTRPAETVASGLIHFLALCAEAFALGMPRIIVTALAKAPRKEESHVSKPSPQIQTSLPSTRPSVPNRKPTAAKANEAPAIDWRQAFLIRATGKIRSWEAFEHYSKWAKEKGLKPSAFPAFESELERLGVRKETDPILKRDFLLEVAIKTTLKAVS